MTGKRRREKGTDPFSAVEETERNMREAIKFHIQGLRAEGYEIPKPVSRFSYVEVAA